MKTLIETFAFISVSFVSLGFPVTICTHLFQFVTAADCKVDHILSHDSILEARLQSMEPRDVVSQSELKTCTSHWQGLISLRIAVLHLWQRCVFICGCADKHNCMAHLVVYREEVERSGGPEHSSNPYMAVATNKYLYCRTTVGGAVGASNQRVSSRHPRVSASHWATNVHYSLVHL